VRTPKPIELPKVSSVTARTGRRRLVVFVALTLYVFGLVMVASASSGIQLLNGLDQWALFRKQLIFGIVGIIGMWIAMRVPLEFVRRMGRPLVYACVLMMLVVMVPGVGHHANGAARWIDLGPFQLQPSEPLKLSILFMVADHLARSRPPEHWLRDLVKSPGGVALGLAAAVVGVQKDLGSGFIIGIVVMVLYMLAGTKWRVLWRTIGPGVALVALSILTESYRRERFLAFLDPWHNPTESGYQLVQALIAIGSGGAFGVGLGHSVQKIAFLPEAHTDMIFAITIEELGVVGVLLVVGCFAVLAAVGARIAMRAKSRFSALLAAGLVAMVVGQAITNIAGVTGVMPLTGVPLPLISYGGSSLIITLTALGLLANIATERRPARVFALEPLATVRGSNLDGDLDDDDADSVEYDFDYDDDEDFSEHDGSDEPTPAGGRRGWRHRRASRPGAGSR
jgi:cell division protein FtsW